MNNSQKNQLNLLDLPDEVLLAILRKLNMVDVLSSVNAVNRRFDRLTVDYSYVRHLDVTDIMCVSSLCNQSPPANSQVLSRICRKILPRICHLVHRLTVEECSAEEILAKNYPQLSSLSLLNFNEGTLLESLTGMIYNVARGTLKLIQLCLFILTPDDINLRNHLSKQITHLNIDIIATEEKNARTSEQIFALILSLCKELVDLNFCDVFPTRTRSIVLCGLPQQSYMSSTLIKLKITLSTFYDCLYLLNAHLNSLSTLILTVIAICDLEINLDESVSI